MADEKPPPPDTDPKAGREEPLEDRDRAHGPTPTGAPRAEEKESEEENNPGPKAGGGRPGDHLVGKDER